MVKQFLQIEGYIFAELLCAFDIALCFFYVLALFKLVCVYLCTVYTNEATLLNIKQGRKRPLDTPERKIKHTVMTKTHYRERERILLLHEKVTTNYYNKLLQEKVTRKGNKKK